MCTLTFVAVSNKFIITHNRDEKILRHRALEPRNYLVNKQVILFPKDEKAGGTWFAISKKGTIIVLLNGGEVKHEQKLSYRKSRGIIVLDLITSKIVINEWDLINLEHIEPFTLVLFENSNLYQLRWNGTEKLKVLIDKTKPHIWSSATLYSAEIVEQRVHWFNFFLKNNTNLNENKLIHFHQNTENENTENGLIINRNNEVKTLSITQSIVEDNKITTKYIDLIAKKEFLTSQINI